jgi:hypothetical protein
MEMRKGIERREQVNRLLKGVEESAETAKKHVAVSETGMSEEV